jgi:hypothetical protein
MTSQKLKHNQFWLLEASKLLENMNLPHSPSNQHIDKASQFSAIIQGSAECVLLKYWRVQTDNGRVSSYVVFSRRLH